MEPLTSGIYEIICNAIDADGSYYVGRSKNIKSRWKRHDEDLRTNKHHSIYLQRAWNKYGEKEFEFKIIEEVGIEMLKEREAYYLEHFKGVYNMSFSVDGVIQFSPETRAKMTAGQKRHWEKRCFLL